MNKKKLIGNILLFFTAIIWGTAFAFQREGMEYIEPITFTASRMTLAAVVIGVVSLLFSAAEKKREKLGESSFETAKEDETGNTSSERKQPAERGKARITVIGGICCGLFLTFATFFQQVGIVYTSAGKAGFITALYILFVPILSFVILRKRSGWMIWTATALGLVGMFLLCMTEDLSLSLGDGLVFICAGLFSGHIMCCDHFAKKANPLKLSAVQFVTSAVVSWVAAFIFEEPGIDKILSAIIPIVYCGLVSGGVGYTLQMIAQKYTQPAVASLLMSLESVFAVIGGAVILGERMSGSEITGCIVMFAAIIMVQIPQFNEVKENHASKP
ncbi:MAG: DMT family transporter [Lachnospiraceae bacterium]|nr:DMT family transporter [Lachnospiraceae bacterium]